MKKKIKASDYISIFFKKLGVKHVFALAGGHLMHLMDSFVFKSNIKYISTFHETPASMMTKAYSRATNNYGVLMVTSGPAGTNSMTGVASAWTDSIPMMVLSGQFRVPTLDMKKKLRGTAPQQYFPVEMVKSITKYAKLVTRAKDVPKELSKAYIKSMTGRKGPVWLDLPLDVQGAFIEADLNKEINKAKKIIKNYEKKFKNKNNILKTIKLIKKSKRPLLVLGNGVKLSRSEKLSLKLVQKLRIPVLTTYSTIDLIDDNHAMYFGRPGLYGQRQANLIIQNCDLLISIGSGLHYELTGYNYKKFAKNAKKLIIDIDINELSKQNIQPNIPINSDCRVYLMDLLKACNNQLKNFKRNKWLNYCKDIRSKYKKIIVEKNLNKKVNHYNFFDSLSKLTTSNDKIVLGNAGFHAIIGWQSFKQKKNQKIFVEIGAGCMGHSLPSAIGSSLALNNAGVICVTGDGGIQVNLQELQTILTNKLPLKIFIMHNGGYISLVKTQQNYFSGRKIGSDAASGFKIPNFKKIVKSYGYNYNEIFSNKDLDKKVKENLNSKKAFISIVYCDPKVRLMPYLSTRLKKNGVMESESLEYQNPKLSDKEFKKVMIDGKKF